MNNTVAVICVVEDDASLRQALSRVLKAGGFEVRAYGSVGEVLLDPPAAGCRGCMLLDLCLPDASGLDLQHAMARWENPPPVVVLSGTADVADGVRAMKRGAVDFLCKPVANADLFCAVEHAIELSTHKQELRARRLRFLACYEKLSERERQVLDLVVAGHTNREIGERLGIAERTVKLHRAHIMEKTGAQSLPDLVRLSDLLRDAA
ncbi:response regulator [Niveibacterium sp. SC-1]|uniref:response regulator transcription factor n=1 Tax=Niveibacterium sp. SC-1 TaxID=3135646 RepID=UPI00311EB50B